jgi:hypothetical protein
MIGVTLVLPLLLAAGLTVLHAAVLVFRGHALDVELMLARAVVVIVVSGVGLWLCWLRLNW